MALKHELTTRLESIIAAQKDLRAKIDTQTGLFTDPTAEAAWRKSEEDFTNVKAALDAELRTEKLHAELLQSEYRAKEDGKKTDNAAAPNYDELFWRFMTRKDSAEQPDQVTRRMLETRGTSTQISSTTTLGGYLVPTSFSNQLEVMMKWYGGILEAGQVYNDEIGGPLNWPCVDDTATVGEVKSQGSAATVADLTFGNITFGDYTVDSNIIKLSRELMQDERVGLVQQILLDLLSQRLGQKVNTMLTTGTGTGGSYGFATSVTNGINTVGSATAITQGEIMSLLHSVDKAYRSNPKTAFMMHDGVLAYVKKLDLTNTNTVQVMYPTNFASGEPMRLYGYPIIVNNALNDLTSLAPVATTKYIYFGDWSKYVIRRIKDVSIERNDQLYWNYLEVGFMGWLRIDGKLINANAIKYLATKS